MYPPCKMSGGRIRDRRKITRTEFLILVASLDLRGLGRGTAAPAPQPTASCGSPTFSWSRALRFSRGPYSTTAVLDATEPSEISLPCLGNLACCVPTSAPTSKSFCTPPLIVTRAKILIASEKLQGFVPNPACNLTAYKDRFPRGRSREEKVWGAETPRANRLAI